MFRGSVVNYYATIEGTRVYLCITSRVITSSFFGPGNNTMRQLKFLAWVSTLEIQKNLRISTQGRRKRKANAKIGVERFLALRDNE